MHVISADTTVADTIRYDTPSIGSDTIPIIVRSLITTSGIFRDVLDIRLAGYPAIF